MFGTKVGDTAYFDPELRSIVHYRGKRYLMMTFYGNGEQRIDEYATGTSGFHGAEGTWRDAEDGHLQGNAIAQGAVDSTISHHVNLAPDGERTIYMVMVAGESREELIELHKWLTKMSPQGVIDRTTAYGGCGWAGPTSTSATCRRRWSIYSSVRYWWCGRRSTTAARSSRRMTVTSCSFSRDTYSYVWPRDGALVADSLDLAGFPDIARWFYSFCAKVITDDGYFYHKYNPDGSPASSWHPWVIKNARAMPIQEDETALVVWAMWRHYYRYRVYRVRPPLWVDVVQKAADFMCRYRDPRTGLPHPSYDLWEERWGVHAFTVATVYGGLKAARNFAVCFGDREKAEKYNKAAEEIRAGAAKYLWSDKLKRFVRRLVPKEQPVPPDDAAYVEATELKSEPKTEDYYEVDEVIDASLYAIFKFHLFEADDERVEATMKQVEEKAVGENPRGRRGAVRERLLPPRQQRHRRRAGESVVHLHAVAGGLFYHASADDGRAKDGPADLRVDRESFARKRRAGRAGQPVHQRADQRQPIDVVARDRRQHRDQIP